MTIYSRIAGTGGYLPAEVRTNGDISKLVDTSDEWIFERTGIRERRIAGADETASSMAEMAARCALDAAGLQAAKIDLIIVATSSPDTVFPSTACLLQGRLQAAQCAAFDIQAACSGFIYALSIADQFIKTGQARKALVVGSEINSRLLDWTDRSTCVLFGDGAGAVLLTASEKPGILSTHIHSDGNYSNLLYVPNPTGGVCGGKPVIHMSGNEVFKVAVNTLGRIVDETLAANHMQKSDIDWLVPHQANIRIINATAKKLGMALDKVVLTIERQGNTSSASVPLALDEAVRDGRIKRGDTLLMEAFGGGFVWGSALVNY
ncbi:MAG: beta-ketoacyl-ACP synthase III [Methylococcales bacterium]